MKTIFFMLLFATVIYSCKKEGPIGPKGDTGATGATGPKGTSGLSNQKVYFGTVVPSGWTGSVNSGYLYAWDIVFPNYFYGFYQTTPVLNVDSATFLMYIDLDTVATTHSWAALPYSANGNTTNFYIDYTTPDLPQIFITRFDGTLPPVPTRSYDFKMVVISR